MEHDPRQNYYALTEDNYSQLKTIACFDLVANSTDRKPNHLILDHAGKLWSIDHGLTFSPGNQDSDGDLGFLRRADTWTPT